MLIILILIIIITILFLYKRLWFGWAYLAIRLLPFTIKYRHKFKDDIKGKRDNSNYAYKLLTKVSKNFAKIAGIKINVQNIEYLNTKYEENLYIVGNHTSVIDVLMFQAIIDKVYRPVGKIELESLISINHLFKMMGMYFIDRKNLRESVKLINQITDELEEDVPVLIYPEGMVAEKPGYRNFKSGSLKPICEKGGKLLIHINYDIFAAQEQRKAFSLNSNIDIEFLEPIDVAPGTNTVELANKVEEIIVQKLTNRYGPIEILEDYEI